MHEAMRRKETRYAQVEKSEKTADALGISAYVVQDMARKRIGDYKFDITRMASFQHYTGPYLQVKPIVHSVLFDMIT